MTAQTALPNGYGKFQHRTAGKVYVPRVALGMPARFHYLRRWHKTASAAEDYGRRFCDRYNRIVEA